MFTDGITSPLFSSSKTGGLESLKIDTEKQISSIRARVHVSNCITQLGLLGKSVIAEHKFSNWGEFVTQNLGPNEVIIGLYGVKGKSLRESSSELNSLGFIVIDTTLFK